METDKKLVLRAHVLPGTSADAGWSPSGWRPGAAGCWATGRAARHLWGPEPGHRPDPTHTHTHTKVRRRRRRKRLGGLQVCNARKRPAHLCTFPRYPVVIRKDSTVDQPRRTLSPQLHLCFLNSVQRDRWVAEQVGQQAYFWSKNGLMWMNLSSKENNILEFSSRFYKWRSELLLLLHEIPTLASYDEKYIVLSLTNFTDSAPEWG